VNHFISTWIFDLIWIMQGLDYIMPMNA